MRTISVTLQASGPADRERLFGASIRWLPEHDGGRSCVLLVQVVGDVRSSVRLSSRLDINPLVTLT
jgi:hypothetical protein